METNDPAGETAGVAGGATVRVTPRRVYLVRVAALAMVVLAVVFILVSVRSTDERTGLEACRTALDAQTPPGEGTSAIVRQALFSSGDWVAYHEALEARGYGGATPVGEYGEGEREAITEQYAQLREHGTETVWVVWDMPRNATYVCEVALQDGGLIGIPRIGTPIEP